MEEEIVALKENETWDLTPIPDRIKPISCKWVYKVRRRPDMSKEKYKDTGFCSFNFSAVENILWVTATDCWASLAPYHANVKLALSETEARHCISDFQQIMESKGASESLLEICSVHPSNLTKLSCPVIDANEIERKIDSSALLDACEKIDPTNVCCNQVCQNAISDAAEELAVRNYTRIVLGGTSVVSEHSSLLNDCKNIVLRWLASKLDPISANRVLRVLTSCKINEGK
ncbi:putative GPI-anchored protein [Abeliophyllum distichum]|uniref:GPI-anchored protein n=1 Tax=Abeliophyllum distichum TaxID=126358 RepID=A0ABD1UHX9_9LAMI